MFIKHVQVSKFELAIVLFLQSYPLFWKLLSLNSLRNKAGRFSISYFECDPGSRSEGQQNRVDRLENHHESRCVMQMANARVTG
jgi:hypothetical protein